MFKFTKTNSTPMDIAASALWIAASNAFELNLDRMFTEHCSAVRVIASIEYWHLHHESVKNYTLAYTVKLNRFITLHVITKRNANGNGKCFVATWKPGRKCFFFCWFMFILSLVYPVAWHSKNVLFVQLRLPDVALGYWLKSSEIPVRACAR